MLLEFYDTKISPRYYSFTMGGNAAVNYPLEQDWPDYVKKIIGICCYSGGVDPNGTALAANTNLDDMFLTLQKADKSVFDKIRLEQMMFSSIVTSSRDLANRFRPVNIDCGDVDLFSSFIWNPGAANVALCFGILYI